MPSKINFQVVSLKGDLNAMKVTSQQAWKGFFRMIGVCNALVGFEKGN